MKQLQKTMWFTLILVFTVGGVAFGQSQPAQPRGKSDQQQEQPTLVGRIAHIDGNLLRYVSTEKDWVATVKEAPFGMEDALYSDDKGRAEFIMPNETWIRVGGNTQIQMIRLSGDLTETDVASGLSRFYNKSSNAVFKVTTPFGYVMAPAQSIFDLYVGDQSVEVVGIKGSVDFIHIVGDTRYEVLAGEASILADGQQVGSGEGTVDEDWDAWNNERDSLWSKRVDVRGDSVRFLPEQIRDESYVLEEQGKWERVYHEKEYRNYWRPAHVERDWVPYSRGRWVDYYEDPCWIPEPEEDFGYITHHYGNWVNVDTGWYWAPPVIAPVVTVGVPIIPFVGIGFGWWPGRVGWINNDVNVGWFPLGYNEPWYGHRHWGHGAHLYNTNINININNYAYAGHAVVVNQNNFFNVNNYNSVRVTNINHQTIINNYNAAPVLNNRVIANYNSNPNRFLQTNAAVGFKPHNSVTNRIQANSVLASQDRRLGGSALQRNVGQLRTGQLTSAATVKPPSLTNRMVSGADVHRPLTGPNVRSLKPQATKPNLQNLGTATRSSGPSTLTGPRGTAGATGGPSTLTGPRGTGGATGAGALHGGPRTPLGSTGRVGGTGTPGSETLRRGTGTGTPTIHGPAGATGTPGSETLRRGTGTGTPTMRGPAGATGTPGGETLRRGTGTGTPTMRGPAGATGTPGGETLRRGTGTGTPAVRGPAGGTGTPGGQTLRRGTGTGTPAVRGPVGATGGAGTPRVGGGQPTLNRAAPTVKPHSAPPAANPQLRRGAPVVPGQPQ